MIRLDLESSLGQAGLRIQNAIAILSNLTSLIPAYTKQLGCTPTFEAIDDQIAMNVVVNPVHMNPAIPLGIGDCIHSLRASLDYMINEICAKANPDKPISTRLHFPFHAERDQLKRTVGRMVEKDGLPQGIADIILDAIKPWAFPDGTGNTDLWCINRLDGIDKHRLLVPTVITTSLIGFGLNIKGLNVDVEIENLSVYMQPIAGSKASQGAISSIISVSAPDIAYTINDPGVGSYELLFADTDLAGQPVIETLTKLCELTLGVFNSFYAHLNGFDPQLTLVRNAKV